MKNEYRRLCGICGTMNEIYKIINIIAIVQGIFLGAILLFNRKNRLSTTLLSFLLFCIAISMSRWHFLYINYKTLYYYTAYLNISFYLLFGPLIYFYSLAITSSIRRLSAKELIHFLPFLGFFFYMIIRYHFIGQTRSVEEMHGMDRGNMITLPIIIFAFLAVIIAYILVSFRVLKKYHRDMKDFFSNIERIKLTWLNLFLSTALVFCMVLVVSGILFVNNMTVTTAGYVVAFILYAVFLASIFMVTYFSIRYPEMFAREKLDPETRPYESHNVEREQQEEYRNRIIACMERDRPYLNDALTLREFARMVDIPPYLVSMTLNLGINQNFYNFINQYRIKEAKRMLADSSCADLTVLRIAFKSGFNSKTTFNSMFKKFAGVTPSQFREKSLNGA